MQVRMSVTGGEERDKERERKIKEEKGSGGV